MVGAASSPSIATQSDCADSGSYRLRGEDSSSSATPPVAATAGGTPQAMISYSFWGKQYSPNADRLLHTTATSIAPMTYGISSCGNWPRYVSLGWLGMLTLPMILPARSSRRRGWL